MTSAASQQPPAGRQQNKVESAAMRKLLEGLIGTLDQEHERGSARRCSKPLPSPVEVVRHRVRHRFVVLDG